jgi:hypothetical protein
MIKCPFSLLKRQADGTGGEIRFQIEVPDEFMDLAHKIERYKGHFFIAVGPMETVEDVMLALKGDEDGESLRSVPQAD